MASSASVDRSPRAWPADVRTRPKTELHLHLDGSLNTRRAAERIGLTLAELWAIDRHGLDAAFAEEPALAPLRTEFDAWAAGA